MKLSITASGPGKRWLGHGPNREAKYQPPTSRTRNPDFRKIALNVFTFTYLWRWKTISIAGPPMQARNPSISIDERNDVRHWAAVPPLIMVTEAVAGCVAVAPVPTTVNGKVPSGASVETVRVSIELSPELMKGGLNAAVTPAGRSETSKLTICGFPDVTAVLRA